VARKNTGTRKPTKLEIVKSKLELARDAQGAAEREMVAAETEGDAKRRRRARANLTAAQRLVDAEEAEEKAVAARKQADAARELAQGAVQ